MRHARGEWIIFADADDFFTENFDELLNEYYSSSSDIIYFKHKNVLSDDLSLECNRCYLYNDIISNADISKEEKETTIRCRHNVPWAKIIRSSFIRKYGLEFEEIYYSNDIMFNIQAGCLAKKIELVNKTIYTLTERKGSLTSDNCNTIEELLARAEVHIRMQAIIVKYGYHEEAPAMWFMPTLFKRDLSAFYKALKLYEKHKLSMKHLFRTMLPQIRPIDTLILLVCIAMATITTH